MVEKEETPIPLILKSYNAYTKSMLSAHKRERLTCGKAREEKGGAATTASREDLMPPKQQRGTEGEEAMSST